MAEAATRRIVISPLLCVALSAMFWQRSAQAALPPAPSAAVPAPSASGPSAPVKAAAANGAPPASDDIDWSWLLPPVRFGGNLSYDIRHSSAEQQKSTQRGILATLKAGTDTYIWQPWFGRMGGTMNFSTTRNRTRHSGDLMAADDGLSHSQSAIVTGNAYARLFPFSRYPFEVHIDRNNSRLDNDLALPYDHRSQRIGVSQSLSQQNLSSRLSFERTTQESASNGRDTQDHLQLNLSYNIEAHRMQMVGNRSHNQREQSGEYAKQNNLMLQHAFAPSTELSVDSTANVNTSEYLLEDWRSSNRMVQFSSQTMWRPEARPVTVVGGVRVLSMAADNGDASNLPSARTSSVNANIGASYDLTHNLHANASANVNLASAGGRDTVTGNQTAGVNYQSDARTIAGASYSWSANGSGSHRSGDNADGLQLMLQLSHSLTRSITLQDGSIISADISQSGSVSRRNSENEKRAPTRLLTHSGSVSWSYGTGGGSAMVRLSASDSRALDGSQDFFQMVNFQASSNLPTGGFSSWTGSLTIQGYRQGSGAPGDGPDDGVSVPLDVIRHDDFIITSTGALTYQNGRMFGVRNLRFVSDLRMNAQALLPVLNGPREQEMAAWDNRFDYAIGRTQVRLNALVARVKSPTLVRSADGSAEAGSVKRMNRSIMFSVSRAFGDF